MKWKALCIDLDGTLIDTLPAMYQVYSKFLAHYGKKGSEKEFQELIGPSIDEIVVILKKRYNLTEDPHELSLYYVSLLMMQGFEGTKLFPHVKETLDALKKHGVKVALVTSGTKPLVKTCLEPLHVENLFDLVVTSEDVKQAKPNPEMYKLAVSKLGLKPNEVVAIEDSEKGIEAAKAAGLQVVMITHLKGDPKSKDPSIVYKMDWREIAEWLQQK